MRPDSDPRWPGLHGALTCSLDWTEDLRTSSQDEQGFLSNDCSAVSTPRAKLAVAGCGHE